MKTNHKKSQSRIWIAGMICLMIFGMALLATVVSHRQQHRQQNTTPQFNFTAIDQFPVTSEDLQDGVWADSIANTERGKNLSPQLTWEKVEQAEAYVIYMIDPDGNNWIHMISDTLTKTSIRQGEIAAIDSGTSAHGYIGPYPPKGTHRYEVYVFALKEAPDSYPGKVNTVCDGIGEIVEALDIDKNGECGNIAAYGKLTGSYTKQTTHKPNFTLTEGKSHDKKEQENRNPGYAIRRK